MHVLIRAGESFIQLEEMAPGTIFIQCVQANSYPDGVYITAWQYGPLFPHRKAL